MKKTSILLATLLLLGTLAGCGGGTESQSTSSTPAPAAQTAEQAEPALTAATIPAAEAFAGGSGTAEDPYQIATAEQLALLAEKVNSGDEAYNAASYRLTADIALNDTTDVDSWGETAPEYQWLSIGSGKELKSYFGGTFDGAGYTIRGLFAAGTGDQEEYLGLFGAVRGATIENVQLAESCLRAADSVNACGGIVAYADDAVVENCVSEAQILCSGTLQGVGGVLGGVYNSTVTGCTNRGTVQNHSTTDETGGVAGLAMDTILTGCTNEGSVSGTGTVGGVAGSLHHSNMELTGSMADCRNTGVVFGQGDFAGGVLGYLSAGYGTISLTGCENEGTVTAAQGESGGVFGRLTASRSIVENAEGNVAQVTIENCNNTGAVAADKGITGGVSASLQVENGASLALKNCTNTGTVTSGEQYGGGVIGNASLYYGGDLAVESCTNQGTVESDSSCGGILGSVIQTEDGEDKTRTIRIADCTNQGPVTGRGWDTAGVTGSVILLSRASDSFTMENCTNEAPIAAETTGSTLEMGGVIGGMVTTDGTLAVTGCRNTGDLTLRIQMAEGEEPELPCIVGGVIGSCADSVVLTGCESSGTISVEGGDASRLLQGEQVGTITGTTTMEEIEEKIAEASQE